MCELYSDDCQYDKPPPMSQLIAMARRLQEADQTIAELQSGGVREQSRNTTPIGDALPQDMPQLSPQQPQRLMNNEPSPSASMLGPAPSSVDRAWGETPGVSLQNGRTPKQSSGTELTIDEHGNTHYYGPTSAVREPSPRRGPSSPDLLRRPFAVQAPDSSNSLAAHARESAIWEDFAFGNAALATGIPRQTMAKLLHIHFTWVGPMFLWVHRSSFIRTPTQAYHSLKLSSLMQPDANHKF
jgi:hypothetical protein